MPAWSAAVRTLEGTQPPHPGTRGLRFIVWLAGSVCAWPDALVGERVGLLFAAEVAGLAERQGGQEREGEPDGDHMGEASGAHSDRTFRTR
jgi:hypothetical protein